MSKRTFQPNNTIAQEDPWVPPSDADPCGSSDRHPPPVEGPVAPVRLTATDVRRVLDEGRPVHGTRMVAFLAPGRGQAAFVAGRRVGAPWCATGRGGSCERRGASSPRMQADYDVAWVASRPSAGHGHRTWWRRWTSSSRRRG